MKRPAYRLFDEILDLTTLTEKEKEAYRESFGYSMLEEAMEMHECLDGEGEHVRAA